MWYTFFVNKERAEKLETLVNDLLGLAGVDREDRDAGNLQREASEDAARSLEWLAAYDRAHGNARQADAWLANAAALRDEFGYWDE